MPITLQINIPAAPKNTLPNIYSDGNDEAKDTATSASAGADTTIASARRSTGGMSVVRSPLNGLPFTALQRVGRYLPPAAAAQYSLTSKLLHDAWYLQAKEAVKKTLKAEFNHLCNLADIEDKSLGPLAAKAMLNAVAKLPAADQVEVLVHILRVMHYGNIDEESDRTDNTVSALKKVHCMELLAQAALQLKQDDPLQVSGSL
jgi:hypothetical protein